MAALPDVSPVGKKRPNKRRLVVFTGMLMVGLVCSQWAAFHLSPVNYRSWSRGLGILTMLCLSFLMVNVGYEFDIDKSRLGDYGKDYVVAMSAAGLPWLFVAAWLHYMLPGSMAWGPALLMARFAAPTSAGILFSMLEAAGLKETWLFKKARILAIFDDLDTILLMIPLKMYLVGFKWELLVDAIWVSALLRLAWTQLHKLRMPSSTGWTLMYAAGITAGCEFLGFLSGGRIHFEVLLPAFVLGCAVKLAHSEAATDSKYEDREDFIKGVITTVFMLLVGLSMPSLFGTGSKLGPLMLAAHVFAVSVLMIVGKMLLLACYRDESDLRTRLALSLGMCPRGEVGAGVIAVSLGLGIRGTAVTVAVLSLGVNLLLSSGFIVAIERLVMDQAQTDEPSKLAAPATQTDAISGRRGSLRHRGELGWGQTRGMGLRPRSPRVPVMPPLRCGAAAGRLCSVPFPAVLPTKPSMAAPRRLGLAPPSNSPALGCRADICCMAVAAFAAGAKWLKPVGSKARPDLKSTIPALAQRRRL